MKEISAYQAVDGTVFEDEDAARKHDEDCIGEEIDALLLVAAQANVQITRSEQFRMCLYLLNHRSEIRPTLKKLVQYLDREED